MANRKECDICHAIVDPEDILYLCLRSPGTKKDSRKKDICQRCAEMEFPNWQTKNDPDHDEDQDG